MRFANHQNHERSMRRSFVTVFMVCLASAAAGQTVIPHQWMLLDDVVGVDFITHAEQLYRLEYTTDPTSSTNWLPAETVITGNGNEMFAFDPDTASALRCYRIVEGDGDLGPIGPVVRAEDCQVTAFSGQVAYVGDPGDREVLVSTDEAGDPTYAVGDIQFNFPGTVSNGTYRLTVHWRSGTVAGTPWAFMLGSDSGSVTENGGAGGAWHYFFPGQSGSESDQWFTHDLAGPSPVDFAMWVNSPVAASITVNGVGANDFYVRVWDMSPSADNYFAIEYFELVPTP